MLKAKRNRNPRTCVEGLESRLLFATFTVTTNADTGAGSLRQAILDANAATGQQDTINFALPGGQLTITPATALPALTDTAGVIIDASTQTGYTAGNPVVTLASTALDVQGGSNTVKGFIFQAGSISTSGTGSNTIVGNHFLGTSATRITINAANDRVGAAGLDGRNVINGGTTRGIFVNQATNVVVENNNIGTNAAGTAAAANAIGLSVNDSTGLTVLNNVISGNTAEGITFLGSTGVTIQGNLIGVTVAGNAALANGGDGIEFQGTTANVTNNVISANGGAGINGVLGGTVQGNQIGTDINGTLDLGNAGDGLTLGDDMPDIIDNVISGNDDEGISIETISAGGLIQNNRIGTNDAGTAALANGGSGIFGLNIGQTLTIENNVISGNVATGVTLDTASSPVIQGNFVGTDLGGAADLGNGSHGISITGSSNGATVQDNVVSGNVGAGVDIGGGASDNTVINNRIGTDDLGTADLGNDGPGVAIRPGTVGTPSDNTVGGTATGTANIIAFNGAAGVAISGTSTGNQIVGNSIFSNTGIGIDLVAGSTTGRTANDADDTDTGANAFQNFPVITQAIVTGGATSISGLLDSTPSTTFRVEFFSDTETTAANVEGRTFLGFSDVQTNASGIGTFTTSVPGVLANGTALVATATNSTTGNTSEFSDVVAVGTQGPDIQVSGNGAGITNGDSSPSTGDFTDFGPSVVGTPISRIFTITNTGQSDLTIDVGGGALTVSGPGASQFALTDTPTNIIPAGTSSTFTITFTPTSAGSQTATVSIVSNDSDENPYTFNIVGQGTTPTPAPEIEVFGNAIAIGDGDTTPSTSDFTNFGTATIGISPVNRTFTITNAGTLPLAIGGVTISGAGAPAYAVTAQPVTSIDPGQSSTFTVQLSPSAGGQFDATINIGSNDANEDPFSFAITGIAVAGEGQAPTAALVDPQPAAVLNSPVYDFIVRYTDDRGFSSSTFDSGDVVVTGPNGFSQAAQFVSSSGNSTQFDVTYRINAPGGTIDPTDNGAYTVTLQSGEIIDTDGNSAAPGSLGTFSLGLETRTSAGQFGVVNGRKTKFSFVEPDNTVVTITLTSGTGEVFKTTNGRFDLEVSASAGRMTVTTKGGNGRAEMNSVRVVGGLRSMVAKTSDITGVLSSTGILSSITLGSASSASISTPAPISSLTIQGVVVNTQVFSGAILGNDGRFGGAGDDADTFGQGQINRIKIGGAVTNSLFAAGFDPVDATLLNGNGIIVGGATSRIGNIRITGAVDTATRFTAGSFPTRARLGNLNVITAGDPRFDPTA